MSTRRISRWVAGVGVCFALVITSNPNRASDPKSDVKWETARTTQPEDLEELKALQARVKTVVDKCTPSTVAILIGFGAGSGVIVSDDGLVLTAAHVIADVFKIVNDPFVGKLTYFRVYSGSLEAGGRVLNVTTGKTEREVVDEINREYAYQTVVLACEEQGYHIDEQSVAEDGTIKLSVSKWG